MAIPTSGKQAKDSASTALIKPSRARYWVIFFAVTLSILAYIDRVCISQAAPLISRDLGFDKTEMGLVFAAFALAYALFEVPGGWMGDWMGPRKVLMRIVIWWSIFTAATGAMWNLSSMVVTRFLFGAGEAGCFPNLTKAFSIWLPLSERVAAQGIMWTFARWGGAFTPPLVIFALGMMSWHWAFVVFGALGVVWAVAFYLWFRDHPKDHPSVNAGELDLLKHVSENAGSHGNVPWALLLKSRSVWLLWVQYFLLSFPWYFYITWLPTYLQEGRHLPAGESANFAILPLLFGGMGSLFCGFISPRITHITGSVKRTRRILGSLGFLGAGVMLILSIQLHDPLYAMICMGLASFCNDLVMPGAWAACMDIGGSYAGTLAGSMNMMGNLAGFVAPLTGGLLLDMTKKQTGASDWNLFLYMMAGVYLLGTIVWPFIDPVRPLEEH
ncbi:MAG: MFS transporter [Bryobacterales bacterium]|nr:MFS transporter [Bryobacterales bacterium]